MTEFLSSSQAFKTKYFYLLVLTAGNLLPFPRPLRVAVISEDIQSITLFKAAASACRNRFAVSC
jgi:hypothetical protein